MMVKQPKVISVGLSLELIFDIYFAEFLLGNRILSAPVIKQGHVTRDVYLPKGKWYDPNQNKTNTGPIWLIDYPAPIDVLPYFIRQD